MSFSGSLIQNAIYIAQQPPEWPIASVDWERAAEEKLEEIRALLRHERLTQGLLPGRGRRIARYYLGTRLQKAPQE